MNFKLHDNDIKEEREVLESIFKEESINIYIKKHNQVYALKNKNHDMSSKRMEALQTFSGTKSNQNHKNDMNIQKNMVVINKLEEELKALNNTYDVIERLNYPSLAKLKAKLKK